MLPSASCSNDTPVNAAVAAINVDAVAWKKAALSLPPGIENGGVLLAGHGLGWDIALLTLAEQVP